MVTLNTNTVLEKGDKGRGCSYVQADFSNVKFFPFFGVPQLLDTPLSMSVKVNWIFFISVRIPKVESCQLRHPWDCSKLIFQ